MDESGISSIDKGKGRELDVPTPSDSQRSIRRERSPTPSMLMRRKTDGEAIRSDNGPRSAGYVDKKTRFNGSENRGKGGKKKDGLKRRHSSNDAHTNVYTACGRHSDDWLFGGFSVAGVVKKIWQKESKDSD